MATHSRILAWENPWTAEPGGLYSPWGRKESGMTQPLSNHNLPEWLVIFPGKVELGWQLQVTCSLLIIRNTRCPLPTQVERM